MENDGGSDWCDDIHQSQSIGLCERRKENLLLLQSFFFDLFLTKPLVSARFLSFGQLTMSSTIDKLASLLIDTSLPLKLRFRILFTLKNLASTASQGEESKERRANTSAEVVQAISQAFQDTSALLKHECAYCLGQMGDEHAIDKLLNILNDSNEDPMVRHEAGRFDRSGPVDHSLSLSVRLSRGSIGSFGMFQRRSGD